MNWGIPVAPEAWDKNWEIWGDAYSNFNAGKILLILEGLGGVEYSVPDDTFTFADCMPPDWNDMTVMVPIGSGDQADWITCQVNRQVDGNNVVEKTVSVTGNTQSTLYLQPWLEGRNLQSASDANYTPDEPKGHISYTLSSVSDKTVTVYLNNVAPTVVDQNAVDVGATSATLTGKVTATSSDEDPTVHIYWGDEDRGTNAEQWDNDVNLGTRDAVEFHKDVFGLASSTTFYYRCYAENSYGSDWADSTTQFSTPATSAPKVVSHDETSVTNTSARLNGEVTETGNENPTVHIYWGDNSGGSNPASWDNDENLGTKGAGTFYLDVSKLTPGTTYYYRCYATNSYGSVWADATIQFTTESGVSAPTVVNSAATDITSSSARLNGEVTSTGGENPTVHIYWGNEDGGTTAESWDNDENLGTKGAETFYKDISGLSLSTTYYFRSYATNSGGNEWADSTAQFDTTAGALFEDGFDVSEWNGVWTEDAQNDWFRTTSHKHGDDGPASACVDGTATDATLTTVSNIDVSGSSTVTVDCWWWIDSGLDDGEYLKCEYKLDSDSWAELDSLDGNVDTENYWHHLQLDVNTSGKSNMLLRFKGKMSRSNEDAYVDTVKVTHKN